MKKDIHPEYRPVVFMDTSTGYQFLSGSTKTSKETVEFEGETYPLIRVEISSDSHPFYTGRQKFTQADGRVDRFNKKYGLKSERKPCIGKVFCLYQFLYHATSICNTLLFSRA